MSTPRPARPPRRWRAPWIHLKRAHHARHVPITEHGRGVLADWLSEIEPPMRHVTNALFAKVLVAPVAELRTG
jgi:hypothetical protein